MQQSSTGRPNTHITEFPQDIRENGETNVHRGNRNFQTTERHESYTLEKNIK